MYSYNVNFLFIKQLDLDSDKPDYTDYSKRKMINLPQFMIRLILKKNVQMPIIRTALLSKRENNQPKKLILAPTDTPLLIGILVGVYLFRSNKSKLIPKWNNCLLLYKHPYTLVSIRVLALLVNKLLINNQFYQAVVDTNDYFVNNYTPNNITEAEFIKKFNKYVKSTLYHDKVDVKVNRKYKKLNALTTLIIAINSFLLYPNNIANLIKYSGIIYQRNPVSCAIACCFYGLLHGFHGVPPNLYTSIENYDDFIKKTINPFLTK